MDDMLGNIDGTFEEVQYFKVPANHGLICLPEKVELVCKQAQFDEYIAAMALFSVGDKVETVAGTGRVVYSGPNHVRIVHRIFTPPIEILSASPLWLGLKLIGHAAGRATLSTALAKPFLHCQSANQLH
jgi:hypothetical protein